MKIILSNQSELPIYAQIAQQIREQILSGEIQEGEVLPSIRKLAKELRVSVITTTRAYSELEQEGFIASVQGKGSIVQPRNNELLREQYICRIEEGLETAVQTARLLQMEKEEVHSMLDEIWKMEEMEE